ncbi:MAG: topoisomerase, partial [Microbacteriaceae bacterium]|nr:topoisomerase [Microbacteriaceae bacterium]
MSGDRGSGSVLGLSIVGAVIALLLLLLPLAGAIELRQRVSSAADAAALAAADVESGAIPGIPCREAGRVTAAVGAVVERCEVDGGVATVRVRGGILGLAATATATAGPPRAGVKWAASVFLCVWCACRGDAPIQTRRRPDHAPNPVPGEVESARRDRITKRSSRTRSKVPGTKKLVIVESPAKAKTIGQYLGDDYEVLASVGHIRDLIEPKNLPPELKKGSLGKFSIDVENGFAPYYVVSEQKRKTVADLKRALKNADELYLATDEDREGEAIAWHLLDELKPPKGLPVHRMVFHEITKAAILAAV